MASHCQVDALAVVFNTRQRLRFCDSPVHVVTQLLQGPDKSKDGKALPLQDAFK